MPRGDKSSYTSKQRRRANKIEEGYKERGVSEDEAERRAWATVNQEEGGGKKSGSGRGRRPNRSASRKGGRKSAATRKRSTSSTSGRKSASRRSSGRKSTARTSSGRGTTARKSSSRKSSSRRTSARKAGRGR